MSLDHKDRSEYFGKLNKLFLEALSSRDFDQVIYLIAMVSELFKDRRGDLDHPVPEMADLFDNVAFALSAMKKRKEAKQAEEFYQRSMAIRERIFGKDDPRFAMSLELLASHYREIGQSKQAESLARRAETIFRHRLGQIEMQLPQLIGRADYEQAIPLALEARDLTGRLVGDSDPEYAQRLNNIAYLFKRVAHDYEQPEYFPEAERLYREALEIWHKAVGETHPDYAAALNNLGELYRAMGDLSQAEPLLRQALEIRQQAYGADSREAADGLNNLGLLYQQQEDFGAAERMHRQALEIRRNTVGDAHAAFGQSLNNLAEALKAQSRYSESEPLLLRALQILESIWPPSHPDVLRTVGNLLELYEATGDEAARDRLVERFGTRVESFARGRPYILHLFPTAGPLFREWAVGLGEPGTQEADPSSAKFQQLLRECIRDFANQNYSECLRQAVRLCAMAPTYEVAQILVVSGQMSAGPYRGEETGATYGLVAPFLLLAEDDPWQHNLLRVTLGVVSGMDAVAIARGSVQQCQAHYYAAMRLLAEGEANAAHQALEACLAIDVDTLERRIAERMRGVPAPPRDRELWSAVARLNQQVTQFLRQRRRAEALERSSEAYELATALPKDAPPYRHSLYNLAFALYLQGEYSQAKHFYQQLLELGRGGAAPNPETLAGTLNGLGLACLELAEYGAAERLFREAIETMERAGLTRDPNFPQTLGNLAELYRERADLAKALPMYETAIALLRDTVGKDDLEYARWLTKFGGCYLDTRDYQKSEPLLEEALRLQESALPEEHPEIASTLNVLGALYTHQKRYGEADAALQRVLHIFRVAFGEKHVKYATALNNLANVRLLSGRPIEAREPAERAAEILKEMLSAEHPNMATATRNMAAVLAALGQTTEAFALLKHALPIEENLRTQLFAISSERQRMALIQDLRQNYSVFLSLAREVFERSGSSDVVRSAFDLVLHRKAVVAEAHATQRDEILQGHYPELEPKVKQLHALRTKIAGKLLGGPGVEGETAHAQLIEEWTAQREELETELARQIPIVGLQRKLQAASREMIAQVLSADAALVEFVRFDAVDFTQVMDLEGIAEPRARYLAFVLLPQEPDGVAMIDLGEAEPIDRMITEFREAITGEPQSGTERFITPAKLSNTTIDGTALRAAIFDPLLQNLGKNRKRLYLVPDGDLTRLPFEVLPINAHRHLIDEYQVTYLTSGRDLISFGTHPSEQPGVSLVVADPDFDLAMDRYNTVPHSDIACREIDRSSIYFPRLPGTRREGERIAKMLQLQPMLDQAAVETKIRECRSPQVLHIATHGFFLEDQKAKLRVSPLDSTQPTASSDRIPTSLENPLLRSGLALAGANTWFQRGSLPPEAEDGILTAEDVAGLDLLHTELVVLSACDTGLGEIKIGEGVFGLQRAFVLAGVRTLVMSLWNVSDNRTEELMVDFYKRLGEGKPRGDALHEAQLALKEQYPNPRFWGAFVCHGDPGPLSLRIQSE